MNPPSGSNSIGFVLEQLREHFVKVFEDGLLNEFRVNEGHSVDSMGTDDGEVGHPHFLLLALFNKGHPGYSIILTRELLFDLLNEVEVD